MTFGDFLTLVVLKVANEQINSKEEDIRCCKVNVWIHNRLQFGTDTLCSVSKTLDPLMADWLPNGCSNQTREGSRSDYSIGMAFKGLRTSEMLFNRMRSRLTEGCTLAFGLNQPNICLKSERPSIWISALFHFWTFVIRRFNVFKTNKLTSMKT